VIISVYGEQTIGFFGSLDIDSIHSLFLFPSAIDICNCIPLISFPNVKRGVSRTDNIGMKFILYY